jgi:hypothetical protein
MNRFRTLLSIVTFGAIFTTCAISIAQVQTNPAGTVEYTTKVSLTPCGPGAVNYAFSGWEFIDSSNVVHTFDGLSTEMAGGHCLQRETGFTATSSDGLYQITTDGPTGVVIALGVQGYIDPKYVILGVIYAPPGNSSYVNYGTTTAESKTTSISDEIGRGKTLTTTVSASVGIPKVASGTITDTNTNSYNQSATASSAVTLSSQVVDGRQYSGTPTFSPSGPFAHDSDQIILWLNPALIFTVFPGNTSQIQWNGYGVDTTDPAGPVMDVVAVPVAMLNGDLTMAPDLQQYLSRSWASGQTYAPNVTAALTQTDYDAILLADPFANPSGQNYSLGYPAPQTSIDGRFSLSGTAAGTVQTVDYEQATPGGGNSNSSSAAFSYSDMTSTGQSTTFTSTTSTGVDASFTGSDFLTTFSASVNNVYSFMTTDTASSSITNTTSSSATAEIYGPPCGATTAPCVPVYTGPAEFDLYQDNIYGTFMFYPIP